MIVEYIDALNSHLPHLVASSSLGLKKKLKKNKTAASQIESGFLNRVAYSEFVSLPSWNI